MQIKSFFPIADWLPRYDKAQLRGDLSAGLTVGVMLIPQGMAYAMLAGIPPIYGLYASILPLVLYAIFGTSRQLAVGPVAMVSLLTAAGLAPLAEAGTAAYVALAISLALLVGLVQLGMGLFRLGFLVNLLSHPVIAGFTSAAALIIGFSQLKHLLGIKLVGGDHLHEVLLETAQRIGETNLLTLGLGIVAVAAILFVKKMKWQLPGPLVAVVFGILSVWLLGLHQYGVKIVGEVPSGLPMPQLPGFELGTMQQLLPIALTISFIGFMESIAVAKAIQRRHKDYQISPNQELVALGMANLGGAFLQAFPTTGGFSRTAVNDQAGAKTGMASIFSALLITVTLLFLTPLFYYLPNAILAAVIMVAVFGLIDFKEAKHLWHTDRSDFAMMAATFVGTLVLGIEEGILLGVALSLAVIIFRTARPHYAVLGKIPGKTHYRNIERFDDLEVRPDILAVRFDAMLYFANVSYFRDTLDRLVKEKGEALKLIILDAESISGLDSSGVHALSDVIDLCQGKGIQLFLSGVKGPVRDILHRSGMTQKIGEEHFFFRIQHAVDFYDQLSGQPYRNYALQVND